ncbi:DNA polymerase III subunit chi [Pelomonas sp. KK5]|uniref:DNA polymerase III subunit chi n=1 Tax=Pelomonas sp. KK5 TaxID=1855730 RepID=UPI001301D599|nr:DNA polymerase III subunit chi [Pelomonas sp. KK5]
MSFYTGVPERLAYLCRLLRKVQRSGARVGVCGPANLLMRLDAALWTFEPLEFVPHLRVAPGSPPAPRMADTPILLVEHPQDLPHRDVLLNLDSDMPPDFEQFARVLEVVSQDPMQMDAGRQRYRQYQQLGHDVSHHVVAA